MNAFLMCSDIVIISGFLNECDGLHAMLYDIGHPHESYFSMEE